MGPPVEPPPRAAGIDARPRPQMLAEVEQHIDERRPHLARRAQVVGVVAVTPHAPPAVNGAVDGARTTDRQPLRPAGEREGALCLDDEVDMVGLHAEVDDAEERLAGRSDRALDGGADGGRAERRKPTVSAQGDVDGMPGVMNGARGVRRRGPRSGTPAPGVRAPATPGAGRREGELLSDTAAHRRTASCRPRWREVAAALRSGGDLLPNHAPLPAAAADGGPPLGGGRLLPIHVVISAPEGRAHA
jgi:hypothetical protein